jgi:hypothetical protein
MHRNQSKPIIYYISHTMEILRLQRFHRCVVFAVAVMMLNVNLRDGDLLGAPKPTKG